MNKINNVVTDLVKGIFFFPFSLILVTVFIIDNRLVNGVVSGKYFWFYGSMGLVSMATLIHSFANKQSFRISLTDMFVFLFTGSVFLSTFLFGDISASTTKLTLLTLLLILYLFLRLILDGDGQKVKGEECTVHGEGGKLRIIICFFIIITGLVEAVWGLMQLYGFKPSQHALFKMTGSFFNPGPYAGYLAVVFPMALHYWVRSTGYTVPKFIAAITCIAILLVLPAAMSRSSWLAAIAGSIVILVPRFYHRVPSTMHQVPFTLIRYPLLILLLCLLFALSAGMYYIKKNSADGRLLTWKVSLTALVKHPLGVGLEHFPNAYGDAQAAYFASGNASETEKYVAGNPEYGFNEFLQIAIESGIVSLLLFIGMLVCAFRGLLKNKNRDVMGSLVALLVFACFSYPFSVLPFPIVFVCLLAMSGGGKGLQVKPVMTRLFTVICFICILLLLYKQYPVYKAYKQWNNNRMYYQAGMYKEAAVNYKPLFPYLNDQIQFLFEYGRSLSQSEQPGKSNEVLQQATKISCDPMLYNVMGKNYKAMKKYDLAEQCLLKSTHIVPGRLYPYYLLMKLYVEMGDKQKARETAGIVLTKEPKVQSQAVKEMREEAKKIEN